METMGFKVNRRALISMDGLKGPKRQQLVDAVEQLQRTEPAKWPKDRVVRISDTEPLYLLRFSPDLWAFFTPTQDSQIEILDLVHPKTLELFRALEQNGDPQG